MSDSPEIAYTAEIRVVEYRHYLVQENETLEL